LRNPACRSVPQIGGESSSESMIWVGFRIRNAPETATWPLERVQLHMMNNTVTTRQTLTKTLTMTALAAAAALALAAPAGADIYELGDQGAFPAAACPAANTCQVIDQLSGFQLQIGAKTNPFRVTKTGRLVAFTVVVPQITAKQATFFNNKFSNGPTVRVSILRPAPRKGVSYRYSLVGQSANYNLSNYLGSTPTFPLVTSLSVHKNDIVAVTTDTWLPAFSVGLDSTNVWRASRNAKKCDDVSTPAMQQTIGQLKVYGCGYKAARLLYRATIVASPPTTAKPKK
jgi:hypothetical protein